MCSSMTDTLHSIRFLYAPFLNDKNPLLPRVLALTNYPNNGFMMLGPIKRVQSSGSCPTLVSDGMDLKESESSDSHHVLEDFLVHFRTVGRFWHSLEHWIEWVVGKRSILHWPKRSNYGSGKKYGNM